MTMRGAGASKFTRAARFCVSVAAPHRRDPEVDG